MPSIFQLLNVIIQTLDQKDADAAVMRCVVPFFILAALAKFHKGLLESSVFGVCGVLRVEVEHFLFDCPAYNEVRSGHADLYQLPSAMSAVFLRRSSTHFARQALEEMLFNQTGPSAQTPNPFGSSLHSVDTVAHIRARTA